MITEKSIRIVLNIFVVVYVARYLGPEQFGTLNYAISFVGILIAIAMLGLEEIMIRNLVQDPRNRDILLGTAFGLKCVGSFIFFALVFFFIQFTSSEPSTKQMVYIISIGVFFRTLGVIDYYFKAQIKVKYITISQFLAALVSSAAQVIMILIRAPLLWFAWALVLENMILSISLLILYLKQRLSIRSWRFNRTISTDLLQDSWPLMFSGLMIMIYMRIDQVMIKELIDADAVGLYSAAVYLSEAWYFIPMALTASLFPAILNAKKADDTLYEMRLQKLFDLMFWLALFVAVPMTFFAEFVIDIFYDKEYILASDVLRIHIWAGIFVFTGVAAGKFLVVENLVRVSLKQTFIGCVSNIILNYFLIPPFGIKGAAIATLISQALVVFSLILHARARKGLLMIMHAMFPFYRKDFFTVR